ncbi:hypothetical protein AYI68_g4587 [Smittium mucronatum]|uniref:Uncharacterized protein n=1 Tax=Smittium mucronatum TaxID=133383 RepID=A0A1R0GWN4_9FUNG|nr:hypothetical protein AYI68_g4587 [Smittium mucronatum]
MKLSILIYATLCFRSLGDAEIENDIEDNFEKFRFDVPKEKIEYYDRGFKEGYFQCKADSKAKRITSIPHITSSDLYFIKKGISDNCISTQCNLDFSFGKADADVLARIQCLGCSGKIANLNCMNKVADKISDGKNAIESNYFSCFAFGSWTFTPSKVGTETKILRSDLSKYGDLLPVPKKKKH